MHVVAYWAVRTAMFLAVYAGLWALKWFDVWAVLLAFVVAWAASYVALPGMRRKAAAQMDGWINRSRKGIEADEADEDAEAAPA